ncbi:hypothetical protein FC83_GL001327 [Agrilactobacillus composti DSM 18527 = JCM 14202]|uniref:YxeA family protein n=1 Tax=Agrilactobacillus composti DSM 18527 = JCM 14202 TaxID=1423734 RepID=X0PPY5_9LACO|nr:YxeA family protein [Agrilactobacillus composti]KRM30769.1 hypothetical protein FC83_GL001327 [Agrilactobacillus composti DSM 18527 = JCM 14202]GAF39757.1 hypothetical protein JCM14202_1632 [Agrilactobacillus composti DSM 18527 = JCM 14202]
MKKFLIGVGVFILVLLAAGGVFAYFYTRGTPYYTQITTTGRQFDVIDDDGVKRDIDFAYNQMAYDQDGHGKELDFNGHKSRPLKMNAYLKISYNKDRDRVLSWEQVSKADVPKAALSKLNK